MAKQAKLTQTDYTEGGRDISNTAIPLYQTNLERMDDYLSNPSARIDDYLNKYYTNTTAQNDFLSEYNRAMAQKTGANYQATSGGYSSQNQQSYDDLQKYYNDQANRLYDLGVSNAYNMATGDYSNMLSANTAYNNAYQLGKAYSDVEQYNGLVDQANSNWFSNILGTAGQVANAIPNPVSQAIGAGLQVGTGLTGTDTSNAFAYLGVNNANTGLTDSYLTDAQASQLSGALQNLYGKAKDKVSQWWMANRPVNTKIQSYTPNLTSEPSALA